MCWYVLYFIKCTTAVYFFISNPGMGVYSTQTRSMGFVLKDWHYLETRYRKRKNFRGVENFVFFRGICSTMKISTAYGSCRLLISCSQIKISPSSASQTSL